jgi:hypothetical protein
MLGDGVDVAEASLERAVADGCPGGGGASSASKRGNRIVVSGSRSPAEQEGLHPQKRRVQSYEQQPVDVPYSHPPRKLAP